MSRKYHHSVKRNRKYDKLTDEDRSLIMSLKQQGIGCREIAKKINRNLKTIQSVHNSERKSEYKSLKEAITQYGLDQLLQITSIESMDERQLKKLATKITKSVMPPINTTMFAHLIPSQKIDSNKRRIVDQIVNNILDYIQKNLITRNMKTQFEANNSQQSDTSYINIHELSYYSSSMMYDDSDALDNHYLEDSCQIILMNQYNSKNTPQIYRQFEGQSINFLKNQHFEKAIEQSSDCYFDLWDVNVNEI